MWASGAAQAAQVVRIILRWFGVCEARAAAYFAAGKIGFARLYRPNERESTLYAYGTFVGTGKHPR